MKKIISMLLAFLIVAAVFSPAVSAEGKRAPIEQSVSARVSYLKQSGDSAGSIKFDVEELSGSVDLMLADKMVFVDLLPLLELLKVKYKVDAPGIVVAGMAQAANYLQENDILSSQSRLADSLNKRNQRSVEIYPSGFRDGCYVTIIENARKVVFCSYITGYLELQLPEDTIFEGDRMWVPFDPLMCLMECEYYVDSDSHLVINRNPLTLNQMYSIPYISRENYIFDIADMSDWALKELEFASAVDRFLKVVGGIIHFSPSEIIEAFDDDMNYYQSYRKMAYKITSPTEDELKAKTDFLKTLAEEEAIFGFTEDYISRAEKQAEKYGGLSAEAFVNRMLDDMNSNLTTRNLALTQALAEAEKQLEEQKLINMGKSKIDSLSGNLTVFQAFIDTNSDSSSEPISKMNLTLNTFIDSLSASSDLSMVSWSYLNEWETWLDLYNNRDNMPYQFRNALGEVFSQARASQKSEFNRIAETVVTDQLVEWLKTATEEGIEKIKDLFVKKTSSFNLYHAAITAFWDTFYAVFLGEYLEEIDDARVAQYSVALQTLAARSVEQNLSSNPETAALPLRLAIKTSLSAKEMTMDYLLRDDYLTDDGKEYMESLILSDILVLSYVDHLREGFTADAFRSRYLSSDMYNVYLMNNLFEPEDIAPIIDNFREDSIDQESQAGLEDAPTGIFFHYYLYETIPPIEDDLYHDHPYSEEKFFSDLLYTDTRQGLTFAAADFGSDENVRRPVEIIEHSDWVVRGEDEYSLEAYSPSRNISFPIRLDIDVQNEFGVVYESEDFLVYVSCYLTTGHGNSYGLYYVNLNTLEQVCLKDYKGIWLEDVPPMIIFNDRCFYVEDTTLYRIDFRTGDKVGVYDMNKLVDENATDKYDTVSMYLDGLLFQTDEGDHQLSVDQDASSVVRVEISGNGDKVDVRAYDDAGGTVWSYAESSSRPGSQCETVQAFEYRGAYDAVIVNNSSAPHVTALNWHTGETLWQTEVNCGDGVVCDFSKDGVLYMGGYFGPDCTAIDSQGNVLWSYSSRDYTWLTRIDEINGIISLYYEYRNGSENEFFYNGLPESDNSFSYYLIELNQDGQPQ